MLVTSIVCRAHKAAGLALASPSRPRPANRPRHLRTASLVTCRSAAIRALAQVSLRASRSAEALGWGA